MNFKANGFKSKLVIGLLAGTAFVTTLGLTGNGIPATAMAEAVRALDLAYGWLEQRLQGRTWAAGEALSLADCAAAPSLFYADWVHPIAPTFPTVRAYRSRLLAWPAFARAVDEARPFRHYFPLGAPDRD